MGNVRYQMEHSRSAQGGLQLLYVSSASDEFDWPCFQHSHPFTELFYIRRGSGSFVVDSQSFPVETDDLIVIHPHVFHTEISSPNNRLSYIAIGVEGLHFSSADTAGHFCFHSNAEEDGIPFYFTRLLQEMEKRREDYPTLCHALLNALCIQLKRLSGSILDAAADSQNRHELFRIKRYIDANFQNSITLEQLAGEAHLNKYYLVHSFTNAFGLSPISYLNERRIQNSKYLLASTDHSIAEIAQLSGFSSQCYFAQSFKKACGMTAREYRKHMQAE